MEQTTLGADRVSTLHASASTCETAEQPRHWNAQWGHIALFPRKDDKDGVPVARRPIMSLPEHCGASPDSEDYQYVEQYWQGISYTWESLNKIVTGEQGVMRVSRGIRSKNFSPKHIGLSPYANGLVVLDCDVKHALGTVKPAIAGMRGIRFGTVGTITRRGIDDLALLCSALGHDLSELATYTVRTKSGGYHLYFHQSLDTPITTTTHHREGWAVDVIASEHNWVAAPPTPGYTVVCDYPVATMPDWLAEALLALNDKYAPKGGKKRIEAEHRVAEARRTLFTPGRQVPADNSGLLGQWIAAQLQLVRVADEHGYWGRTLWQVAKDFARAGWDEKTVTDILLVAANPWDAKEERAAIANIRSGYRAASRPSGR